MSISLPYQFDTSRLGRIVLKAMVYLQLVLLFSLVIKLILSPGDRIIAVPVLLTSAVAAYLGIRIFRYAGGAKGVITERDVVVEPSVLYGLKATGPEGRFPLAGFKSVRIEWMPRVADPGEQTTSGDNERIYLAGKDGTPDILVASVTDESGRTFARELAAVLSLPVEERPAPGVHGTRD